MAKTGSYISADGVTHSSSYWNTAEVNISKTDKTARCVFLGYHDEASAPKNSNKASVGQKTYDVNPSQFDTYFSTAALAIKDAFAQCYQLADDTLDENGVSFFDGFSNV